MEENGTHEKDVTYNAQRNYSYLYLTIDGNYVGLLRKQRRGTLGMMLPIARTAGWVGAVRHAAMRTSSD